MRVLVIPDVHLKPWMFQRASALMKYEKIEQAVCLMDIADDWNQQYNLDLYVQTYDAAIQFAKDFPNTLWCYGNHDVCYLWNQRESGYSKIAPYTVCKKLQDLQESLPDVKQLTFIHRIDNVLFMHGGLCEEFVSVYTPDIPREDTDKIIARINTFDYCELWEDRSPIWYRPHHNAGEMYMADTYLQVIGHTPTKDIYRHTEERDMESLAGRAERKFIQNYISCDNFSLTRDRVPYGAQKFLIIDTVTWTWEGVK